MDVRVDPMRKPHNCGVEGTASSADHVHLIASMAYQCVGSVLPLSSLASTQAEDAQRSFRGKAAGLDTNPRDLPL